MGRGIDLARRLRRAPLGLIGMLALVVGIEGFLTFGSDRLSRKMTLSATFAARESTRGALGSQVLGLGDSIMKFGFDPATIARETGLRAYNLSVPGTPVPLAEALLRRALEAGAQPSVVVVGYLSFTGNHWNTVPEFAEVLNTSESLELARDLGDPDWFAAVTLARAFPSIRHRRSLRALASSKLLGISGGDAGAGGGGARASLNFWAKRLGSDRRRAELVADERTDPGMKTRVFDDPWRVVPAFERSLHRLVTRAEAAGARVFWLIPPLAPYAQARRDALGLEPSHTQSLQAIHEQLPHMIVLDARRVNIPLSCFFDSCHLNERGASRLSALLADELVRRPRPTAGLPLWVSLSPLSSDAPQIADRPTSQPTVIR